MCTSLFWMLHYGIWNRCILGFVKLVYYPCINYDLSFMQCSRNMIQSNSFIKNTLEWIACDLNIRILSWRIYAALEWVASFCLEYNLTLCTQLLHKKTRRITRPFSLFQDVHSTNRITVIVLFLIRTTWVILGALDFAVVLYKACQQVAYAEPV